MTTKITDILCIIIAVLFSALLLQNDLMEKPFVEVIDEVKILSPAVILIIFLKISKEKN